MSPALMSAIGKPRFGKIHSNYTVGNGDKCVICDAQLKANGPWYRSSKSVTCSARCRKRLQRMRERLRGVKIEAIPAPERTT